MIDVKALKDGMGEEAMRIMAAGIPIDHWNERKREGLCPFHNEKTPSFSVAPDKQIYHCFGCKKGGGVINFIMEIEGLSFPEAVEFLAMRAKMPLPAEDEARSNADRLRRRVLEQMLYHLGRWVYLIDAADDLQKDAVSGNYNPVALRYGLRDGKWDEESRRAFARTLDHSIHMIATAFELWDFGVWRPLLESTVYTGLFAVGRAVLEGTFHKMPPREQRKKHKKAEETT